MLDLENSAAVSLWEEWPGLSEGERVERFKTLPREEADEFFLSLAPVEQAGLLRALPPGERRLWMRLLPPDDAVDLIQEAPSEEGPALLEMLDDATRTEVRALLAYAEDEAGGLMNPRFARVRPDMTADEAVSYLRKQAGQVETLYYAYVLDEGQRLEGVLSLRELFQAPGTKQVRELMHTELVTVPEDMDQEGVARLYVDQDLLAIPVLDRAGRMKGIITFDDIADVVREEATEDAQKLGGMQALDEPYLKAPLAELVRKRAGWLTVLFVGELLTATAMAYFEEEIARAVVLALFVPLIISSGGNSGSQATTLVIRAMAVGEVKIRDWWRVLRREVGTGFALGSVLGALGVMRVVLWQAVGGAYGEHYLLLGLAVGITLAGVVLWGCLVGAMLPFVFRRFGLDPASASAPFVATLVDVTGLVIYFTVASLLLTGTML
ncbi:MAG: magnesium transporter [Gemmatimonadetes bacterium]|nr:magnesium transporter [Gemmatimonadota bacterium]MBI2402181.1 magnesium transporter [Gemmatimonadota bacterium]